MSGEVDVTGDTDATQAETDEFKKAIGNAPPVDEGAGSAAAIDPLDDDDDDRSTKVDTELNDAPTDQAREEIRARRRESRIARKQHRAEKLDTLERTVAGLTEHNRQMAEQLMRLGNSDNSAKLSQLDNAIEEAAQTYQRAAAALADAASKSDGTTVVQATELMFKARERHTQLTSAKTAAVQQSQRPSPVDPRVKVAAKSWADRNKWYGGPQSTDPDSRVLTMLDNEIAAEGFVPTTDAYWAELDARVKRYIPHRAGRGEAAYNPTQQSQEGATTRPPRSPVGGAGQRGSSTSESGGGFELSSERVKAMKEAGSWDDPARRKAMVDKFKAYDKEQSARR